MGSRVLTVPAGRSPPAAPLGNVEHRGGDGGSADGGGEQPPECLISRPRYRARDPDRPFVNVIASDRVITVDDLPALRSLTRAELAEFRRGYVRLWAPDPAGTWPGTGADMRLVARQPSHALHARVEAVEDLRRWLDAGTLFEVFVDGGWAGVLAGEPQVVHGMRGPTVTELLLDPAVRGRGYGRHLSALLTRNLPMPDEEVLSGTIHVDNVPSTRSALGAGRVDVGGEVTVPLDRP